MKFRYLTIPLAIPTLLLVGCGPEWSAEEESQGAKTGTSGQATDGIRPFRAGAGR